MSPRPVAIVHDMIEENWPSMDLVAEMLVERLQRGHSDELEVTTVCPRMKRRFSKALRAKGEEEGNQRSGFDAKRFNVDRLLNRFWDYPRYVRRIRNDSDLFHIVDHSYSQLVHELPPERTIVTCHDLDTFKCLLEPEQEPRSVFFKTMIKRTLSGFQKAAFVTCVSEATRNQILEHKLISPERLAIVRNGVHPSCSPAANLEAAAAAAKVIREAEVEGQKTEAGGLKAAVGDREELSAKGERSWRSVDPHPNPLPKGEGTSAKSNPRQVGEGTVELLHVGSTIPRKRIDVLLRIFAEVKKHFPSARLLRVGGAFTNEQEGLARELNIRDSILVLPHLDREVLAAVYRRAALVLLPSEREGFGLPVVEAMACGTRVVASDLPVLREVGGEAAHYCSIERINSWCDTVSKLLTERSEQPERWAERQARSIEQAAKFSWAEYARAMVEIYERVLNSSVEQAQCGQLLVTEETEKSDRRLDTARV